MRISVMECIKDCKCDECGRQLKRTVNDRVAIISKTKSITLCKYCFADLKKEISEMWICI